MARLIVKTSGLERQLIELKLGANIIGRSPDCDFCLTHSTISTVHCELVLNDSGVVLRDLESTNGTFVNGERIREAVLVSGHNLRIGDVELFVETTDANVIIPKFAIADRPIPNIVSNKGTMGFPKNPDLDSGFQEEKTFCPKHPHSPASHQCTACKELMCNMCVHRLRRKASNNVVLLCPICSHAVRLISDDDKPRKRSVFARFGETVKLKLTRTMKLDK